MKISAYPDIPLLLVDDEQPWLNSLSLNLRANGINNIVCCSDSRQVLAILEERPFCAMILDLIMPHCRGDELLPQIVQNYPELPIIVITGMDQVDIAVNCMKLGAFDYQTKVTEGNRLFEAIQRAIDFGQLKRENSALKEHFLKDTLDQPEVFAPTVTQSKTMRSIFQYMEAIAGTREPVLITGETGTGKELIAQALHILSSRPGDFIAVNIAGLDDTVFSDTLFGHQKGAFTGATHNRSGLIQKAAGGTLFLDEIGDLEISAQTKLLRLLQEREFLPLGADIPKHTDARTIFATHKELDELRQSENFRQDLFYRLRSHHIHLPPLRDRLEDLPLLVDHFMDQGAQAQNKSVPAYPPELITLLGTYNFPGNIRELRSMIFDAISKHSSRTMGLDAFRSYIVNAPRQTLVSAQNCHQTAGPFATLPTLPTIKESGNLLVQEAMKRANGNQSIAAQLLGISRQALSWRLKNSTAEDKPLAKGHGK